VWQTGSWQRSKQHYRQACELVLNGRIGKVVEIDVGLTGGHEDYMKNRNNTAACKPPAHLVYDMWLGPAPVAPYCPARVHRNWRWIMDYGGGKLMDWVGHNADIAQWPMGYDNTGPVMIEGTGVFPKEGLWNAPTEFNVVCTYADGVKMNILSKGNYIRWKGADGWVRVDRNRVTARSRDIVKQGIGSNEKKLYKSDHHIRNFLDCIASRKPTISPAETGHRVASVGHLCMATIKTGRSLKWDPDAEKITNYPKAEGLLSRSARFPWNV
jgi:predicted dehydrogenase